MSFGGRTFRAFRPSRFVRREEAEEDLEQVKEDRIRFYAERVRAGLPLFDFSSFGSLTPPNIAAM